MFKEKNKQRTIIAFMNSFSSGKSGGDMVFIEIAKRLVDFSIIVVTSKLGSKLCKENNLQVKFVITTKENAFKNTILIYIKRIFIGLFVKITITQDTLFLGTSDFLPDVLPIILLKQRSKNTKWIQHIFHLIPKERKISFYSQKLSFAIIKKYADLVIVDNNLLKDDLIKLGFQKHKVVLNYPGLNIEYLKTIKQSTTNKFYDAIVMAQLRKSKGIFDLVEIWSMVCKIIPNAKLGIIGKGTEDVLDAIKTTIKNYSLEQNIDILGFLPNDQAFQIINNSKIFTTPSYEEGFGIAALEAQTLGLPIVAWALPIFDEIFPQGMITVKIGDKNSFAKEIVKLLTEKDLYKKLSFSAEINAKRFNWDYTAEKEKLLINSIY